MGKAIVQGLTLAFQYVQQTMSDAAIEEMAIDLSGYPEPLVLAALKRCRSELRSIKFSDILDRIPGGHPGPEEAWGIICRVMGNEAVSIVWTDEMREAYGAASALADDPVAARMAFKEVYVRAVSAARLAMKQPSWTVSLGYDPRGREAALLEAVELGRLLPDQAQRLLPGSADESVVQRLQAMCPRLLTENVVRPVRQA